MLLSVIVPIYNAEIFLQKCVDSILSQSFSDFELILVNDGSTDGTINIANSYSDSRITIVNQENRGVSAARNEGIRHAKGVWITFIDADDFVGTYYLEGLTKPLLTSTDIDFIQGGYTDYIDGSIKDTGQRYTDEISTNMERFYPRFRGLTVSKLFRTNILHKNNICFEEKLRSAEDMLFTLDYVNHINKYAFTSEASYYYRRDNSNSITHNPPNFLYEDQLHAFLHEYRAVNTFIQKHRISKQAYRMRYERLCEVLVFMVYCTYRDSSINHKIRLHRLKQDLPKESLSLLNYIGRGKTDRFLFFLLKHELYTLFDLLTWFIIQGAGRKLRK